MSDVEQAVERLEVCYRTGNYGNRHNHRAALRTVLDALEAAQKLPTRWRCLSLDSPEDAPALWGGILCACADELDAALGEPS